VDLGLGGVGVGGGIWGLVVGLAGARGWGAEGPGLVSVSYTYRLIRDL
jgi:hypothetical protein